MTLPLTSTTWTMRCTFFYKLKRCNPASKRLLHVANKHFNQKRATQTYWPSPLITPPTMAQLITWQACLAERISFLIWKTGAPEKKKKEPGQHIKTTEYELSHDVKVRKSNLAGEIPISYSTMTTGSNHGRTLQWVGKAIFQSDRHIQHKMIALKLYFYNYK